jgi:two-component system cell cycle response regulator
LRFGGSRATLFAGAVAEIDLNDTTRDEGDELSQSVDRGPRSEAALTVLRGENPGTLYTIEGSSAVIGRSPEAALSIPDGTLSRNHACIHRLEGGFAIEDLGSTNGTFVDGQRVESLFKLEDGCRIYLGSRTVLHFRLHDAVELQAVRETYALTVRDPLTGAFNRRHLNERMESEVAYSRRHGTPLSLVLLDVDHFKQLNDEHGHAVGDEALKLLALSLNALTRHEDVLARYGGEEFALVARGIDRGATLALAERMRQGVEGQPLQTESGPISLTVSIGIAYSENGEGITAQQLFEAADRALYASKDAGRNRVSIAPTSE